jgi:hypothetical protein
MAMSVNLVCSVYLVCLVYLVYLVSSVFLDFSLQSFNGYSTCQASYAQGQRHTLIPPSLIFVYKSTGL